MTNNTRNEPASPSTLPAEWVPLDALIQAWASFGRATRSLEGLQATSHAFAALALETRARASYAQAMREGQAMQWPPHLSSAFSEATASLSDACEDWLKAEDSLSQLVGRQDEEAAVLVPDVTTKVTCHAQHLFRLFLRMLKEMGTRSGMPLRVMVGVGLLPLTCEQVKGVLP